MAHSEVVTLIQGLSRNVRLVFARELEDGGLDDGMRYTFNVLLLQKYDICCFLTFSSWITE